MFLLHGIPETHVMWHRVAPPLAERFTVVATDLRGFGKSGMPPSTPDHAPYSMREIARDQIEVMQALGFDRFGVVGHDRGARCAYRMALDHPDAVTRLAVLDIVPTGDAFRRADFAAATLDYEHDEADHGTRRITCPTLALWSGTGAVADWYEPLDVWKTWADDVSGGPISAGHFIPEEAPEETTRRLFEFLG